MFMREFSMFSKNKRYICLDVETTGLSPHRGDRVIEVAAIMVERDGVVEEFTTLIDVECRIHRHAEQVHGISRAMLAGHPKPEEVWHRFREFIGTAPLVAHNARFDLSFIRHEMGRLGLGLHNPEICTVKLSRKLYPHLPSHRLESVARHVLGRIPADCRLHRAEDDARLLAWVWMEMGRGGMG